MLFPWMMTAAVVTQGKKKKILIFKIFAWVGVPRTPRGVSKSVETFLEKKFSPMKMTAAVIIQGKEMKKESPLAISLVDDRGGITQGRAMKKESPLAYLPG